MTLSSSYFKQSCSRATSHPLVPLPTLRRVPSALMLATTLCIPSGLPALPLSPSARSREPLAFLFAAMSAARSLRCRSFCSMAGAVHATSCPLDQSYSRVDMQLASRDLREMCRWRMNAAIRRTKWYQIFLPEAGARCIVSTVGSFAHLLHIMPLLG